jgi:hypothetical protein
MDGPYVVQRRVRPAAELLPGDERGLVQELFPTWGVFVTDPSVTGADGYNGCLVRASVDPQVGVISMPAGARVACAFHETVEST